MAYAENTGRQGNGRGKGRKLPKSLTGEQLEALLGAVKGRSPTKVRNRAMLLLMSEGGLRVAEITGLRIGDITEEAGEPVKLTVTGKGDKQRTVHLRHRSRQALAAWLERRRTLGFKSRHVFTTLHSGTKHPPVCEVTKVRRKDDKRRKVKEAKFVPGSSQPIKVEADHPLQNQYLNRMVARTAHNAGLSHTTPHQLRHSAAQQLYDATGDLGLVKEFLGHENIETTTIYAQASQLQVKEALNAMDAPEPEPEPSVADQLMASLSEKQRELFLQVLGEAG